LRRRVQEMASQEVERFRRQIGGLSPEQEEGIRRLAESLANKLLHPPTLALKRLAAQNGARPRGERPAERVGIEAPAGTDDGGSPSRAPGHGARADDAGPARVEEEAADLRDDDLPGNGTLSTRPPGSR